MPRPPHPESIGFRLAAAATLGLIGFSSLTAMAEEPQMPKSLDEAIRMERADALPRTAFYDTPTLAASKPGDLLRQGGSR